MSSESHQNELESKTVCVRRCSNVVKGGKRYSFAAMVVVGDGKGKVGWGYGKANEVPPAVDKATKDGTRSLVDISLDGTTIPHQVVGEFGSAKVVMVPARPGTGIIAGAAVRAVCEAAGIHDILTKSYGTSNAMNLVKAAIAGLQSVRSKQEVERLRGVSL